MEVASSARDLAFADEKDKGTLISAVAYASPAPETGSLAAIQNAVAAGEEPTDGEQAVAALAAQDTRASSSADTGAAPVAAAAAPTQQAYAAATVQQAAAQLAKVEASAKAAPADRAQAIAAIPLPPQIASKSAELPAPGTLRSAPVVMASLAPSTGRTVAARSPELDTLIERYAKFYQVPVDLVRRVVKRESTFNPAARNGPYWGLMQIRHDTAKGMGYDGNAQGLLNAETNLTYAVKYLKGAYITADGDHDQAVKYYSRGYYYDAKRRGTLEEAGLKGGGRTATPEKVAAMAAAPAASQPVEAARGVRVTTRSLPGVASASAGNGSLQAPSSARMGGDISTGATLAIAE